MERLLTLSDVSLRYERTLALVEVTLEVAAGEKWRGAVVDVDDRRAPGT